MDMNLRSLYLLVSTGCPHYIFLMPDDNTIKVYSKLGYGCIATLTTPQEVSDFWYKHRMDT